ncbi:hypothetical protein LCGC14_0571340 [marine sediment metagenome]|uniref:Uncharacterized protein n=1 Tax=marine sediment metagenome TaxID=412755 RepID=A0A0F9U5H8_9ZZZZ
MNNRAEQGVMGVLLMVFILLVLGAIFLEASAQNLGFFRNTVEVTNASITLGLADVNVSAPGQAFQGTITIFNATDNPVGEEFFHLNNNQIVDSSLTWTIGANNATMASEVITISFTSEPEGFSKDSGSRAMGGIILILFAISVVIVSIVPVLREKFLELR